MSLFESMSRDLGTVQRVNIQEVRMNKLNFYEYQDDVINSLKESILENGQMENAIAYLDDFDENGDIDGCRYTLLGGHTRYLAISKLLEEGKGDGYINLSIVEKPQNENEEKALIMSNNVQRKKSMEVRYHEIKLWGEIYNSLEERPSGTKRDWIGSKIGMSGRGVAKVIAKVEQNNSTSPQQNTTINITRNDIFNRLKTNLRALKKKKELLEQSGECEDIDELVNSLINDLNVVINYQN